MFAGIATVVFCFVMFVIALIRGDLFLGWKIAREAMKKPDGQFSNKYLIFPWRSFSNLAIWKRNPIDFQEEPKLFELIQRWRFYLRWIVPIFFTGVGMVIIGSILLSVMAN